MFTKKVWCDPGRFLYLFLKVAFMQGAQYSHKQKSLSPYFCKETQFEFWPVTSLCFFKFVGIKNIKWDVWLEAP